MFLVRVTHIFPGGYSVDIWGGAFLIAVSIDKEGYMLTAIKLSISGLKTIFFCCL